MLCRTTGVTDEKESAMTQYAILLPGNEDDWSGASPAEREATYERHREFMQVLGARGHTITGGAELSHSRDGKTVRGTLDDVIVTEGPFAGPPRCVRRTTEP